MIGRRPGGALGLGVVLLASEVFRTGVSNIPPVTLGFLALNSAIYMRLLRIVRHVGDACVSYNYIWKLKQWRRLLLASFFHLDDMHLYFNMISFLWKGRTLERRYGSRKFFIIIIVFAVLSQILLTILNRLLATMLWNSSYLTSCAAGFSAVIFALKVLTTNNMWEESVHILGLPVTVPAQLACWVELVLIQILVPNASFAGHLAGILVGFGFVYGPLEKVINKVDQFIGQTQGNGPNQRYPARQNHSYTYQSGQSGYRYVNERHDNREDVNAREEQELQEAIRRSLEETHFPGSGNQSNGMGQHPAYPQYGWNIPDLYSQDHDLRNRFPYHSGEPSMTGGNSPYPSNSSYCAHGNERISPPYPIHDSPGTPQYPQQGAMYPDLREFDESSTVGKEPSAPHPDLFGVD